MIIPIILFLVGLVLLIKGGDWFVDGATGIAHKFHVPDLLIGATVVSIGTTLPEVMVSATSAVSGHGEIAYGNAIGSIICNTALIAAISIAVKPSRVDKKTLTIPVIFFYVSTALYLFSAYVTKRFDRVTGVLLLLIFVTYISIQVYQAMHGKNPEATAADAEVAAAEADTASNSTGKDLLLLGYPKADGILPCGFIYSNPAHLSDQHRIYTGAEKRTVRLFSYHKKRAAATVPGKIFNCLFQHYCLSVTDFFILFCSVRFSVWLSFNDCCHTKYSRIPCCSI